MSLIEIQLLNFKARFRKLAWKDEQSLPWGANVDPRVELLALALVDISGRIPASIEESRRILKTLPLPILQRVWIIYKADLPENRFFTTRGLYRAPDAVAHQRQYESSDKEREAVADQASKQMEAKFGARQVREAQEVQQMLVAGARKKGALVPATPEVSR